VTKEEVITAIKECAEKLGHVPSRKELQKAAKISIRTVRKLFGTYTQALHECGMERRGSGYQVSLEELFAEWAMLVRRLGKIPTITDWELRAQHSIRPLVNRFSGWPKVPGGMLEYARKNGVESEWKDVLDLASAYVARRRGPTLTSAPTACTPSGQRTLPGLPGFKMPILPGLPIYGTPLMPAAMVTAPTNEAGVMFLFASMARELGYAALKVQTEFPDCIALRRVGHERSQLVRIECEYESKNFLAHLHDVKGCDMIVCWRHNWPECPLEVLELCNLVNG
jgi:hypothetical protein